MVVGGRKGRGGGAVAKDEATLIMHETLREGRSTERALLVEVALKPTDKHVWGNNGTVC